jgi:hypothetical protein
MAVGGTKTRISRKGPRILVPTTLIEARIPRNGKDPKTDELVPRFAICLLLPKGDFMKGSRDAKCFFFSISNF